MNSGKPVSIVRLLAQGWIAGGVRLWGENVADLSLAIGGAIGLRWLQEVGHHEYLRRMVEVTERAIAEAKLSGHWTPANIVRAMELSLCQGVAKPELRAALRTLLRENWGQFVPQDVVVGLLRKYGVSVPHVFA